MLYDPSKERPVDAIGWVLWNAADYIEEHGWCQGVGEDDYGRVCAVGAIARVTKEHGHAIDRLDAYLRSSNGRYLRYCLGISISIPRWNDAPGRTKEEVAAALRAAALGHE